MHKGNVTGPEQGTIEITRSSSFHRLRCCTNRSQILLWALVQTGSQLVQRLVNAWPCLWSDLDVVVGGAVAEDEAVLREEDAEPGEQHEAEEDARGGAVPALDDLADLRAVRSLVGSLAPRLEF